MSYYDTGTVTLTNGSDQVLGILTEWGVPDPLSAQPDDGINAKRGDKLYAGIANAFSPVLIESVQDNTHLTLKHPWPHATQTGVPYTISWDGDGHRSNATILRYLSDIRARIQAGGQTWVAGVAAGWAEGAAPPVLLGEDNDLGIDASTVPPTFYTKSAGAWDGGTPLQNWLRFDAAQALTAAQKAQAHKNLMQAVTTRITGAAAIGETDRDTLILLNGASAFTLPLTAAATLGNFACKIKNVGSTVVTLDPNGGELIDGVGTQTILPGMEADLYCDGSAWRTYGLRSSVLLQRTVLSGSFPHVSFFLPPGYDFHRIRYTNLSVAVAGDIAARVSTDTGATYKTGASDYGFTIQARGAAATDFFDDQTAPYMPLFAGQGGLESSGEFLINLARSAGRGTFISGQSFGSRQAVGWQHQNFGGLRNAAEDDDTIAIFSAAGNITGGTFILEGLR